jgi:hypothetical protein
MDRQSAFTTAASRFVSTATNRRHQCIGTIEPIQSQGGSPPLSASK